MEGTTLISKAFLHMTRSLFRVGAREVVPGHAVLQG